MSQPDVTLLLDRDGVIREATLSEAVPGEQFHPWLGRRWADTVTSVGSEQIRRMITDAAQSGVSAFGEVTQRFPSGLELPIEYTTVRLGKRAGLIAVGKSVQAAAHLRSRLLAVQRAREQDYWKLREVETRYRLLFDATGDAVVLLAADSLRIIDANPAAMRAFGFGKDHELLSEFAPQEQIAVRALLQRARDMGRVPGILVHAGEAAGAWILRASLTQSESGAAFLLQFSEAGGRAAAPVAQAAVSADQFIDLLPDGFVILDDDGNVRRANNAFLDLAQQGAEAALIGQGLERYLRMPGADVAALLSYVSAHGAVRLFTTTLRGDLGTDCEVEISAVRNHGAKPPSVAMVVRNIDRRADLAPRPALPRLPVAARIGGASLNSLVQEATELVERQGIEAALERTDGNRSAAADLLGLSRQSLYLKLNRYGLGRSGQASADADDCE